MGNAWEYLNIVAEDAGSDECHAVDRSKCWKHGDRCDGDVTELDGVIHKYSAVMGGVNRVPERHTTTADSFVQALDWLRRKGANDKDALKKEVWAREFVIDDVKMPKNVIILGDERKGSPTVARIGKEFGTILGRAKARKADGRSGSPVGNGGDPIRQHDTRRGIPVPPPVRAKSGDGRKGPPVPPGRSAAKIIQPVFQFEEATGKIRKYLESCAEDAGVSSLVDHDKERHHGHFDPETMTCKLRDEIKREEESDRIEVADRPKDEAVLDLFREWLPDTKIRVVSRDELNKELKDLDDECVMFSVSNDSNRRWKNYVFAVEHHQDVKQGYVISRRPPAVAKACFEKHFGVKIADDCPFLAFSNALVQHSYNEHGISFGAWSNAWRKLDNPYLVTSPHGQTEGVDSLCFVLPVNDTNNPTGYSAFAVTYITDKEMIDKNNHGKPYMSFHTGFGINPNKFIEDRTIYYVNTQAMRQPLSTDSFTRQHAEKSPTGASSCVLTEKDFSGQQLGSITNDGGWCQYGDVNGWLNRDTNEVVVSKDSDVRATLLHELGWHATLNWAKAHHSGLYVKLIQYAQEAPSDVVNAVKAAYDGKRLNASELIEEIGAERFTRENMSTINDASEKWWTKIENGAREISRLHVEAKAPKTMSKEEVDAIAELPPRQAAVKLVEAILSGRRLSNAQDSGDGKIVKYLSLVQTEDAWIDSGTGNMAWKKSKRKTPFDRVPTKRIKEIISKNVSLIKTIDADMLPKVASRAYRVLTGKLDPFDFVEWLEDKCDVSSARAYLIATDQIRKAKELVKIEDWIRRGIKFAIWRHHDGVKDPREYHMRKWDGVSGIKSGKPNGLDGFPFRLTQPPVIDKKTGERGYPSTLIGCKCYITGVRS